MMAAHERLAVCLPSSAGESNLDIGIAMTQIFPLNVSLYQVGNAELGGDFNNLLNAIDGDYCTYKGGNDPVQGARGLEAESLYFADASP